MKQNIKTQKSWLNVGFAIQSLLFFAAVGSGLIGFVMGGTALLIFATSLLFLGLWQMGSGVIMGKVLSDKIRTYYFYGSLIYLLFSLGLGMIAFSLGKVFLVIFITIFGGIIPLGIAYWYIKLTNLTLKRLRAFNGVGDHPDGVEDVLDSGDIFNSIK
jgi:hypothetical protein